MSQQAEMPSKERFPLALLLGALIVTVLALVGLVWNGYQTSRVERLLHQRVYDIEKVNREIMYFGRFADSSIHSGTATGDPQWAAQRQRHEMHLDNAIETLRGLISGQIDVHIIDRMESSEAPLDALEDQIFSLVAQGQTGAARAILWGNEYRRQRDTHYRALDTLYEQIEATVANLRGQAETQVFFRNTVLSTVVVMLVVGWGVLIQKLRRLYRETYGHLTRQRQAQAALEEKSRQVVSILENTKDSYVTLDRDWRFTYLNPRAKRILENDGRDLKGKVLLEAFPQAAKSLYPKLEQSMKQQVDVEFEEFYPPTNTWLDVRSHPTPEGLSIFFRDVTKRHEAQDALRQSEERFRNLIEGSLQGIWVHTNWRPLFVNQAAATILGFESPAELMDRGSLLPCVAAHDRERLTGYQQRRMEGKSAPTHYEFDALRRDGSVIALETIVRIVEWEDRKATQATFFDITERKCAEQALRKVRDELEEKVAGRTHELTLANEQLRELDKLKSMFIASMSHELRTPLNSIIGFTGILLQGMAGNLNDKQRDQLSRVYLASKHLLALISDVIDISKIEAGYVDVYPQEFHVYQVIDEAITAVQPMVAEKGLELEVDVPRDLQAFTDRKRLYQCVLNFLSNAAKYTERGMISVTTCANGEYLEIAVRDTGIGIRQTCVEKLFQPFERLDSHLRIKAGGTGLGLYLTKKISTELLQGNVYVESQFAKGSTFTLKIPKDIDMYRSKNLAAS